MKIKDLKNKNIHLVGLSGTEVSAIAEFLIDNNIKNITGHDWKTKKEFDQSFKLYHEGASDNEIKRKLKNIKTGVKKIYFKNQYLKDIKKAEIIFASSSWFRHGYNFPQLEKLRKKIPFYSWYNLFLELYPGKIIGVTGTAGKGTVTNLIYRILRTAKKKVALVGESWKDVNIKKIMDMGKNSFLVMEINNRYLLFTHESRKSPYIAVITNISPNHLDDHHESFEEYIEAKKEIVKYQKAEDLTVLNWDNKITRKIEDKCKSKVFFFSQIKHQKQGAFLDKNDIIVNDHKICSISVLRIFGPHMISNVLAASLASRLAGVGIPDIKKGLLSFKGREHRMEFVRKIKGVEYFDDSASSRPIATLKATESFPDNSLHLIVGGFRKKPLPREYDDCARAIVKHKVKSVILIGQLSSYLEKVIKKFLPEDSKTFIKRCSSLKEAVELARNKAKSGDIVLLSPGAESFGWFRDYRERGEEFKKIVGKFVG